jgi:hypothetical protein
MEREWLCGWPVADANPDVALLAPSPMRWAASRGARGSAS